METAAPGFRSGECAFLPMSWAACWMGGVGMDKSMTPSQMSDSVKKFGRCGARFSDLPTDRCGAVGKRKNCARDKRYVPASFDQNTEHVTWPTSTNQAKRSGCHRGA